MRMVDRVAVWVKYKQFAASCLGAGPCGPVCSGVAFDIVGAVSPRIIWLVVVIVRTHVLGFCGLIMCGTC